MFGAVSGGCVTSAAADSPGSTRGRRPRLEISSSYARRSLRALRPLVDAHPRSDAAVYFARIARKLLEPRPGLAPAERGA